MDRRRETPSGSTRGDLPPGPGSTSLGGPGAEGDSSEPIGGEHPESPTGTPTAPGEPPSTGKDVDWSDRRFGKDEVHLKMSGEEENKEE
ncbi:MAG TPA: hypothetical protein VHV83_19865 [Armatimonadota bacterium]|nr:hypothetical protein [Armatimonadota bacterium]